LILTVNTGIPAQLFGDYPLPKSDQIGATSAFHSSQVYSLRCAARLTLEVAKQVNESNYRIRQIFIEPAGPDGVFEVNEGTKESTA